MTSSVRRTTTSSGQVGTREAGEEAGYDILAGLNKLCEEISETLTEVRYEAVDLDPPA